ncbi:glycine betaine/L-proline ABC transporter ATP-binding protein, partial [Amylibacter sp.]|nr:glycine betaine/L-proline ABC transporter ATP-binding protein [Amylibacter sp.]
MTQTPKVSLRGLYKIFGSDDKAVLQHAKDGMSKENLLISHQHVLGLKDINVEMQAGEITVVMGLSGSG